MARHDGTPNLMQNQEGGLTAEKARELGRAGGLASGQARRQRRLMRETLNVLLTAPVEDATAAAKLEAAGLPADLQGGMIYAVLRRALSGDVEAARFIRDSSGEKPTEAFNLSVSQKPIQSMDLSQLSDEELARLADGLDDADAPALPAMADVESAALAGGDVR